ncbi:MAG: pyridoxal 5'-phosphate synthase glutaminase subunit PdxT [Chloroflexi bacterium]|nr:pyridoxal 5'-phosphate synthase glutaminase subunit PdxT [Chloroflexota bacterium]
MTIGVLALQGDFAEHLQALQELGVPVREVRLPEDLEQVDALIIPGGESTTIANLMDIYQLREPVRRRALEGMPLWGTCAGLILLAKRLVQDRPQTLGLMDIGVNRNAYGRQVDSFEADLSVPAMQGGPFHAVFIRAPLVFHVGDDVQVVAELPGHGPVAMRQGNLLATAFHPELTHDQRFHQLFLGMCMSTQKTGFAG